MREHQSWVFWRAHRRRQLITRWGFWSFLLGGLLGEYLLQVPEPAAIALLGLVLGVCFSAMILGPGGYIPKGWPGYRCLLAAAEGKVPANRYGCWNGLHGIHIGQPAAGACWCKRAELLEDRIAMGQEYPYHRTHPFIHPSNEGEDLPHSDPHLW
jgi:hypothetical protein